MDPIVMVQRIDEVLELVGLKEDSDKRTLEYSGGMRKLLNIATGLLHTPKVLFLDEPTSGIDVAHRQRLLDHIRNLPAIGMTVFLTTHFLEEVDRIANRVALFDSGKVIVEGTPAELKANIGSSILDVTFDPVEALPVQKAAESLRHVAALTKILIDGNRLKLFTNSSDDILAEIRRQLSQLNLPFTSLTIAQPTLDDVFFYHIGQEVT
jgi:ABC-2 type transport system ATP-binding protein